MTQQFYSYVCIKRIKSRDANDIWTPVSIALFTIAQRSKQPVSIHIWKDKQNVVLYAMNIIQPLKGYKQGHISMLMVLWALGMTGSVGREHSPQPCRTPGAWDGKDSGRDVTECGVVEAETDLIPDVWQLIVQWLGVTSAAACPGRWHRAIE